MSGEPRALRVDAGESGRRLDVFLAERLGLSRAQTRRLLARGAVRVDGRRVAAAAKGERVAPGATVEVEPFARPEQQRPRAQPELPLRLLAEGPGWLAVDKAAGVAVHPLEVGETGTVLNAAIARHPELHGVGEGGLRSGVVHRLDVETSGALLVATQEERWRALREAFAAHRVEKVYRALVAGRLTEAGSVRVPLVVARHRPARVRVLEAQAGGRAPRNVWHAELAWRPLDQLAGATLVEVRPVTGFLHQIRATLAHLGFPVLGDRTYGFAEPGTRWEVNRHMLHAARVAVDDVAAASPDPPDFAALCARLRAEA